jgi:hypothetical protein
MNAIYGPGSAANAHMVQNRLGNYFSVRVVGTYGNSWNDGILRCTMDNMSLSDIWQSFSYPKHNIPVQQDEMRWEVALVGGNAKHIYFLHLQWQF